MSDTDALPPVVPRKAVNLTINVELLNQARELKLNLSAILERALARDIKDRQAARWLQLNQRAIGAYNRHVDSEGVFSDVGR